MKTDEKRTANTAVKSCGGTTSPSGSILPQAQPCPKCGQEYTGAPALSRFDNETFVCPDCGTREALEFIGIGKAEQDEILKIIHKHFGAE